MHQSAIVEEQEAKIIETEETKDERRTIRRSDTAKKRSWLMKKQQPETELQALIRLKCAASKFDDSDSASSDDLNTIEDEQERKRICEVDGQLIYLRVLCQADNKNYGFSGTTKDDPATMARKFAYVHNMRLTEQIKLKKQIQEKIKHFNDYSL